MCTWCLAVPVVVWMACSTHFFINLINSIMNVECPKCGAEDAFFNGECYECPSCDYEWEVDVEIENE